METSGSTTTVNEEQNDSGNQDVEMDFSPKTSVFSRGPTTSAQIEWHANKMNFVETSGNSNRRPPVIGPLGEWPKQRPIRTAEKVPMKETATTVPEVTPTTTANANIDGFTALAEDIQIKTENMKLKLEVARLQKRIKTDQKQSGMKANMAKKELEEDKRKQGELMKKLNKIEKSRDSARKANDNNRAKVSNLKKKVKRLESNKHIDGIKRKGAKEFLEQNKKLTSGQVKSLLNPEKRIRYSKEDVIQALVQKSLGTKAFNHLRKTAAYRIPTRQTQERWLGNLMSSMPGFQTDAILAVKELRKRSTDERFHEAVVSFDEMYLSKKMELHRKTQHILGPHNKVMVCMIRGLTSK